MPLVLSIRRTPVQAGVRLFAGLWVAVLLWGRPFVSGEPIRWEVMNGPLLAGTAAMAVVTFWLTAANLSARRAAVFCALACCVSWGAEALGTHSAFPFGYQYAYHPALRPVLPGDVPLFIPAAWWILSSIPLILLRDVATHDSHGVPSPQRMLTRAMLGGLFLAGYDLILDPLGTSVDAWTWHHAGGFFGTPCLNYFGWFVVGTAIHLCYFSVAGRHDRPAEAPPRLFDATWTAANFAALASCGVASCTRLGSAVPILLLLAVAGPFWARWLMLLRRRYCRLPAPQTLLRPVPMRFPGTGMPTQSSR